MSAYSRSSRVIKSAHFSNPHLYNTISRFFAHQSSSENSENVEQERSLSNRDDHQQWCHYRSSQEEKSKAEVSSSTRIDNNNKMSIERVGRRARTRTSSRRRTRPVVRFSRVQRVWVSRATTHGIFCDEREKRTRVRSDQTRRKRRMRVDVTFAFGHRG